MNNSQRRVLFWVLLLLAIPGFFVGGVLGARLFPGYTGAWIGELTGVGVLVGAALCVRVGRDG